MGIIKKRKILTREEETALFKALRDENTSTEEKKRIEETLVIRNLHQGSQTNGWLHVV